ncbi:arginine--tRNA ligase [Microbacterium istanbulense]|uniref:Arginine--tRNA ligase n=1 Tax=Microbacterium istanbulense TaxID=3122049 RepID=A0ABU8LR17_9MICO
MTQSLSAALLAAFAALAEERRPGSWAEMAAVDLAFERSRTRDHGDWASNAALKLAKSFGAQPRELAIEIARRLTETPGIANVEVAGPGFINVRLDTAANGAIAKTIVETGKAFGSNFTQRGRPINLEFVSANPTGPLHIGHARWAALGDSIGRLLLASGATLVREFYINDAGAQVERFGRSVLAAAKGDPTPEDGYPGSYITDLAMRVIAAHPDLLGLLVEAQLTTARDRAYDLQLSDLRSSLAKIDVHFDMWFSERELHPKPENGGPSLVDRAVARLSEKGHVFDEEGAVWVRTTDFGDDKNRVIRRFNGDYTYFAADAAYYFSKGDRGFAHKIYLLGADHHGYAPRLKALAGAAGDDPEKDIEVLVGQLVSIDGARLSKRSGNIIELDDLRDWLGTDALRYWLERYPMSSPLLLDAEILRKRTNDNPVFYVQYAHARTHNAALKAAASGVTRDEFSPGLLAHETESVLLVALHEFLWIVSLAAELREPHRVAHYLEELAGLYHRWYDQCRITPIGGEAVMTVHRSRLWLNDATGQVLRNGLYLLGVSAPERM